MKTTSIYAAIAIACGLITALFNPHPFTQLGLGALGITCGIYALFRASINRTETP